MPATGYIADTFVAGEQPTTAKWNELWGNDASFNNGNGFNDGIILKRHLAAGAIDGSVIGSYNVFRNNNGTTLHEQASAIQSGWVAGQPGVSAGIAFNITFPNPFQTVPLVIPGYGGDTSGTTATLGAGDANIKGLVTPMAGGVTTTGFILRLRTTDGTSWAASNTVYAHWIAIGD